MRKLTIVCVLLLVGLALIGAGYAKWSDSLIVNGDIETGEVDWAISSYMILDPLNPADTPGGYLPSNINFVDWNKLPGFENDPHQDGVVKNVGWGEGNPVDSDGDLDPDTLEFTLHNAYPLYFNKVDIIAKNNGSIPIRIESAVINDSVTIKHDPTTPVELDLNGDGINDVELWWLDNLGDQIEPYPKIPWKTDDLTLWVCVLQGAPQGQSLSFNVKINAVQWNEYQP